jgi:WD40 repeat protein
VFATVWALALAGCHGGPRGVVPAPGTRPAAAAVGLQHGPVVAAGKLGYAVAWADADGDSDTLAAIELDVAFALVLRDLGATPREPLRVALGPAERDISAAAVAHTRGHVFVAGDDGRVRGFDIATGAGVVTWVAGSPATAVAVAPDGRYVAMGTADGLLCLRRYRDGALLQCVHAHRDRVAALAFRPDSAVLASAAWSGEVIRWRVPSLAVRERRQFPGAACALAFAPDTTTDTKPDATADNRLAIALSAYAPRPGVPQTAVPGAEHAVALWSSGTARDIAVAPQRLRGHAGPVVAVAWTPDGRRLLSGSWDRSVRLWSAPGAGTGRELARITGFAGPIQDLAVAPDGRRVAVAAWTDGRSGRATAILHLLYPHTSRDEVSSGPLRFTWSSLQ